MLFQSAPELLLIKENVQASKQVAMMKRRKLGTVDATLVKDTSISTDERRSSPLRTTTQEVIHVRPHPALIEHTHTHAHTHTYIRLRSIFVIAAPLFLIPCISYFFVFRLYPGRLFLSVMFRLPLRIFLRFLLLATTPLRRRVALVC